MEPWSDHKAEIILTVLSVVVFVFLLRFTNRVLLTPSDLTQVATLMVLVVVTVSYAASTHRIEHAAKEQAEAAHEQTEESRRAVETGLRAERNSVRPIVDMLLVLTPFQVELSNVGVGPALNLEVMIIFEADKGDFTCEGGPIQVIGAGQVSSFDLDRLDVPSESRSRRRRYQMIAIYEDIYGQRFRSWAYPSPDLTQTGLRFTFEQIEGEMSHKVRKDAF